jgi:glycosyltransferase involved in cell wall biosynthesis
MAGLTTVAIPVFNGGPALERTLAAVSAQRFDGELELVVCDSGSLDGSVQVARRHGAEVIEIAREQFSHGRTRNVLMERSRGVHVAFLTQDAVPSDELWISRLLAGFALAPNVGLVFGPYLPRSDASPMVARELGEWFRSFSPSGQPRIDRLDGVAREARARALLGHCGFFTDANGCVARSAWEQVGFRDVRYAEDHALAHDMLRAGFAKVYLPDAAVIHSHEYSTWDWLRRSFDEARAMSEVYGWVEPSHPQTMALKVWGRVGADWRWALARDSSVARPSRAAPLLARSAVHHAARTAGAVLGARAERLTPALARRLSLEHRCS